MTTRVAGKGGRITVRIKEELGELQAALIPGDETEAINERVDIANFAIVGNLVHGASLMVSANRLSFVQNALS